MAELDGAQQLSSQEVDTRLNEQPLIPEDYTQLAVGPDALQLLTLEDDKQLAVGPDALRLLTLEDDKQPELQ